MGCSSGCGCGPKASPDYDSEAEGLSDSDLARFGGDGAACPHCGAIGYADAPLCHACGLAIADPVASGAGMRSRITPWIALAGAAAIIAMVAATIL